MEKLIISHYITDEVKYVGRKEFYDKRRTKYGDYCVHVIDMFIFNKYGELLVQKRGKHKATSPGLLNTSVGGHINENEVPDFTVFHECMEEIGVPMYLVPEEEKFKHAITKVGEYTERFALTTHLKNYKKLHENFQDNTGRGQENTAKLNSVICKYLPPSQGEGE